MILKLPVPKIRKNLLFLLFKKNNNYIRNIEYEYKLNDFIDLKSNKNLF